MSSQQDCELIRRWISLSEDHELTPERTEILEAHLDRCGDCRAWHEQFLSGMDVLDLGFDEVVGEIDQLLVGSLEPGQLISEREPMEVSLAAERAAPRFAAVVLTLLAFISLLAWWWVPSGKDSAFDSVFVLRTIAEQSVVELDEEPIRLRTGIASVLLGPGQTVSCQQGEVWIDDPNGRSVRFGVGAKVTILSNDSVLLEDGLARFDVEPEGRGFRVITEELQIRVTGTLFEMRRWASRGHTEVRVWEGDVEVIRGETIPLPLRQGEMVEVSGRGGLMFHAARVVEEGVAPLPRARLGTVRKPVEQDPQLPDTPFAPDEPESSPSSGGENKPLDLPVIHDGDADEDGEGE